MTCKKAAEVGESYFRRFFFSRNLQRFPFFLWTFAVFARLFRRLNAVFALFAPISACFPPIFRRLFTISLSNGILLIFLNVYRRFFP